MKLSIIIPTIGRETLEKVLVSIFESKKNIKCEVEILVIFDGARPENFEISPPPSFRQGTHLKLRGEKNCNIKILETGKKVFASGARNLGIEKSTGDILIFIGDNGVVDKNWLKEIYDFHKKNSEVEKVLLGNVSWKEKDDFTEFFEKNIQFDFEGLEKKSSKSPLSRRLNGDDILNWIPTYVGMTKEKILNWRYFYTSNISLTRDFLNHNAPQPPLNSRGGAKEDRLILFSENFSGWGFEDSEFGYRLEKKGMKIFYEKNCKVFRLDEPNFNSMIEKIKSARKNAQVFEKLHPEIKILPRGGKLFLLKFLIVLSFLPAKFNQKIFWWREWKKSWIGWK